MYFSILLGLLCLWSSLPVLGRQFDEPILDVYDYIVVGGGIAGLTVANRLTEDPNATVLVLEAGPADNYEEVIMVPIYVGADIYSQWDWYFQTEPQIYLDGATRRIPQGKVVGGGSILNAMLWNRGGQGDFNDWASLGNPGWDWNGMLEYFQRSETYTPVYQDEYVEQYGIHYNPDVHGFDGPVNVSFPHYFYNTSQNFFLGLNALGVPTVFDPSDGAHAGATYLPLDISPTNQSRADARRSYYDPFAYRDNFYVSTNRYVTQLIFEQAGCANPNAGPIAGDFSTGLGDASPGSSNNDNGLSGPSPPRIKRDTPTRRVIGVEHAANAADPRTTTLARREVIMAAGSLQTPKILELSGIGDPGILQQNNISVLLNLPGVGNNLQDHYLVGTYYQFFNDSYTYSNQLNIDPNNQTLNNLARVQYYADRTGPWTAGPADGNAFPSLPQISNRTQDIVGNATGQINGQYLADGLDPTIVAGYNAQKRLLIQALADPERAVIEILNSNAGNLSPSVMRPFSRGTSHLNSSRPFDPPRIDPRYGSNPIDTDILYESLLFNRLLLATPPMAELQPLQWAPPADANEAALRQFINNGIGTEYHPSGTCAMLPQDLGGVVDPNLLVYGTQNLRVVDASICPTIPAAHMQAVVYAIAEKASDLIRVANTPIVEPVILTNVSDSCSNGTSSSANTEVTAASELSTSTLGNGSSTSPARNVITGTMSTVPNPGPFAGYSQLPPTPVTPSPFVPPAYATSAQSSTSAHAAETSASSTTNNVPREIQQYIDDVRAWLRGHHPPE